MTGAGAPRVGVVLSCAAVAYSILERMIIAVNGPDSQLATALGTDAKGWLSIVLYLLGILMAFVQPWISIALYIAVALMWFLPDRRIEQLVKR